MSASRVAAWIGFTGLLGAWLASAAGLPRSTPSRPAPQRSADAVILDGLAADVQSQTARLRTRMASAPAPAALTRNPFSFTAPHVSRAPRVVPAPVVEAPEPLPEPEPQLDLIGVAADSGTGTLVRTAMISGPANELMMVTAGQRILGLYEVVTVGADAIELKHVTTGVIRRLALR
jgi:hypothetical protein